MKTLPKKKLAILVSVLIVIIVAGSAGTYYLTLPNNSESPLPSPTETQTASPTQTPTETATPTEVPTPEPSTQSMDNLRLGDYANYTVKNYANGALIAEYPITWIVAEEAYNGTDCWVITVTADVTSENSTTTTILYWYMDKVTYEGLSMKSQTYVDGALVSEDESEFSGPPAYIDPQTIVGQETITVSAGTFTCDKVVVTDAATGSVTTQWYSTDVPIVGLVKMETYNGAELTTARELTASGR